MDFLKGYSKELDNRFSIHIADNTEVDLNAILDFNKQVHLEENIETYIHSIMQKYPRRKDIYWIYIKDNEKDKIVSSLCLSPLEWQIESIDFPVCEMEFVGTLKEYQRKGFIRILNELYEALMLQYGYILSVIRGIPYFYRTLGYVYASSLDERITVEVSKIPKKKRKNISIRSVNSEDISLIKSKYSEFHNKFLIFNKFDIESFKFKYFNEEFNSEVRSTYIVNEKGFPANYFSIGKSFDNKFYEIICPELNIKQASSVLQFIKKIGNFQDNDTITLCVSKHTSLFRYIESIGGNLLSEYGWQVKIPNIEKFLSCIKEVIEARLERSKFRGLSKVIGITNYQQRIELVISEGKIEEIKKLIEDPQLGNVDLSIPGGFLYMLLLGDKSFDEINYFAKDAYVDPPSKQLIEIIFPKKPSLFESYI